MSNNTSIFDAIQTESQKKKLLKELENELLSTPSNGFIDKPNASFNFEDNEAILQAKFYHICRLKGYECHLEVKIKHGYLDAVVLINNKCYIIEFKYLKDKRKIENLIWSRRFKSQLVKYSNENCQIIIITNYCDIEKILYKLNYSNLNEKFYYYNHEEKDLSPLIVYL